MRTTVLR